MMDAVKQKMAEQGIGTLSVNNDSLISMGFALGKINLTYSAKSSLDEKREFFRSVYSPLISEAVLESKKDIVLMMNGVYGVMLEINGKTYEVMYLPVEILKTNDGVKDISFAQFVSLIERYNRKAKNPVLDTLEKMKKVLRTSY